MLGYQHKLFFKRTLKFLIIFLVVDFSLGFVTKKMFFDQETGKYARLTHAIEKTEAELILFGSSYVNRQFIPEVFQNELNMSSYNAGIEGQHLVFHTALQKMILNRYKPKLIILNINHEWMYQSETAYDKLSVLHPYFSEHKEVLSPLLSQNSSYINFKLLLNGYRTNSTLVHIIKYFVLPQKDYNGYRPLYGSIEPKNIVEKNNSPLVKNIEENFVKSLQDFIKNAKTANCTLVFTMSPTLNSINLSNDESYHTIKAIAKSEDIPILDFINNQKFVDNYQYFSDQIHLNDDGSRIFCKLLSEEIKMIVQK